MKTRQAEEAVKSFEEGWSCSQAVFGAFSEALGLEKERARQIAQAFGGGMARLGQTCGAITGGLLTIGLKYGRTHPKDEEAREKTYAITREFMSRFEAKHGSLLCRELIGVDLSTDDGYSQAKERGVFHKLCPKFVADAADLLADLLKA